MALLLSGKVIDKTASAALGRVQWKVERGYGPEILNVARSIEHLRPERKARKHRKTLRKDLFDYNHF